MSIQALTINRRQVRVASLVTAVLFLVVCISWGTTWL
ncbi:EamA family transporter, partial [Pseudomonas aeruginosa]